jgi:hypothetical protein
LSVAAVVGLTDCLARSELRTALSTVSVTLVSRRVRAA